MARDDEPTRRARSHWGDEERASVGRDRRATPARGLEIADPRDRDHHTPVTDLLALIDGLDEITPRQLKQIVRLVWEHTTNVELRSVQRIPDEQTTAETRREFRELQLELTGKDGKNGKIGLLREAVDRLMSRAWWFFTVFVGGIGAAAVKLLIVGRAYGELDAQVNSNRARLQLIEQVVFLRSQPAAGAAGEKGEK